MPIDQVQTILVAGAGTIGRQIALQCALSGYTVYNTEIDPKQLDSAAAENQFHLNRFVGKGRLTQEQADATINRLVLTMDLAAAAPQADFVIEAIDELLAPKQQLFQQLDRLCPPHAILATNSSSIPSSKLAAVTRRPEKVCNMHFFYPVLVMKLVEVVRNPQTSDDTIETTMELVRRIDREPIDIARELPAFIVNRMLAAMMREGLHIVEEGYATPEDVDKAMRLGANYPMGPFALADLSGVDVFANVFKFLQESEPDYAPWRPSPLLDQMVAAGRYGRKTGRGFFEYGEKG